MPSEPAGTQFWLPLQGMSQLAAAGPGQLGPLGAVCRRLRELPEKTWSRSDEFAPATAVPLVSHHRRLTEEAADELDQIILVSRCPR